MNARRVAAAAPAFVPGATFSPLSPLSPLSIFARAARHQRALPTQRYIYSNSNRPMSNAASNVTTTMKTPSPRASTTTKKKNKDTNDNNTNADNAKGQVYRLAPSDFAFLYEECKRCFYLKAHKKLYRPRAPFPGIFNTIDLAMKLHLRGLPTQELLPDMPKGTFLCENEDAWVECKPITPPGHTSSVYIRGMVDCLVRHDDGTFGVIDFKTSSVSQKSSTTYSRQLHAYAMAIENPAPDSELVQGTVTNLGLVVYSPAQFHTPVKPDGSGFGGALTGQFSYVHVERNDAAFTKFIGNVLDILEKKEAPAAPKPKNSGYKKGAWSGGGKFSCCSYCQYLHDAKTNGFLPER